MYLCNIFIRVTSFPSVLRSKTINSCNIIHTSLGRRQTPLIYAHNIVQIIYPRNISMQAMLFMQALRGDKLRLALRYILAIHSCNVIYIILARKQALLGAPLYSCNVIHTSLARRQASSSSPALPLGAPLYQCNSYIT